ncbi:MAG: hypothetical protein C5B50_07550 [Verrucomicrobia bacterium]|nr:MAG: hypothetical protein C5B50_07550 [Verrucomicrobiota bacterium]
MAEEKKIGWWRSRFGFAAFWLTSLVVLWSALRLALLLSFRPHGLAIADAAGALLEGAHRDLFVGLGLTVPILFWLAVRKGEVTPVWRRSFQYGLAVLFWFGMIFLCLAEYFFFDEFKSRFNTVAVDYFENPREVIVNIWDSYPVVWVVLGCTALSLGWLLLAKKIFGQMWQRRFNGGARALPLLAAVILMVLLTFTIQFKEAHVSSDRTVNEIANNGLISFGVAAWTHDLDYKAYYKTLPPPTPGEGTRPTGAAAHQADVDTPAAPQASLEAAFERTRRLLTESNTEYAGTGQTIRRKVAGDPNRPRLNVVLFLEESLGSKFWGCLGRRTTLTPEMDKLATEEGLLFTNIYACGNRTVRGMEGVLSSFPPLPGGSIVKRDRSENVETIARVLKRDGYATVFFYGGMGFFDGMRSFCVANGYDRFIEQKNFDHPGFTTIWGVCDEEVFARAITECRAMWQSGQPFFATILSVSNHKPYAYPKGRIPEDPNPPSRDKAVKYSDFALGQFFRAARNEPFWTNTVFVVVADHGDRVYGSQKIPIQSYEIPLVILGPAVVKAPGRIGQLGSSLDVAPTILGLIGRPYETMFFGHDLLRCQPSDGRALLHHNRDIGLLKDDRLVVLGLKKSSEFYEGDPKRVNMASQPQPGAKERELEADAVALYQVADALYVGRKYRIDSK